MVGIWQEVRGRSRIASLATGVYIWGRGWGSIFPTITPKCLAQLAVCVIVEVLVCAGGNALVAPSVQRFLSISRHPNNLFRFTFLFFFFLMYNKPVVASILQKYDFCGLVHNVYRLNAFIKTVRLLILRRNHTMEPLGPPDLLWLKPLICSQSTQAHTQNYLLWFEQNEIF